MPLALHRSITFWSGLLVMGFVCWAWRDSFHRFGSLNYDAWLANTANGGLLICYNGEEKYPEFDARYRTLPDPALRPNWGAFQPLAILRGQGGPEPDYVTTSERKEAARNAHELHSIITEELTVDRWRVFIPHWLILLVVALPWSALLYWRARRRKRFVTP